MLQIDNLDGRKSDWNLNETHLIIPMIDGDVTEAKEGVRSLKNSLNITNIDGTDQSNILENSLVIELEQNLFDAPANKDDLLVLQGSDMKLLACGNEFKYSLGFSLPYGEKGEIVWENPQFKDSIKSEWCSSQKTSIFEEKDILHYDYAKEPSKTWTEFDKSQQILDENLCSTKIGDDLVLSEDKRNKPELCSSAEKSNFSVTYVPTRCSPQIVYQSSLNYESQHFKKLESDSTSINKMALLDASTSEISSKCLLDDDNNFKIKKGSVNEKMEVSYHKATQNSLNNEQYVCHEEVDPSQLSSNTKLNKETEIKSFLPEKSLPLKKKAKMKRSVVSSDNIKQPMNIKVVNESGAIKKLEVSPLQKNSSSVNLSEFKASQKRKCKKMKMSPNKHSEPVTNTVVRTEKIQINKSQQLETIEEHEGGSQGSSNSNSEWKKQKFKSIYNIIDDLKNQKLISSSVWQTLYIGLKEIKTNILEEMNMKENEKTVDSYSVQLKAFALILYFKQPAAFNYLSKMYPNGWPSLDVLKDWKHKVNSRQKFGTVKKSQGVRVKKTGRHS